MRRCVQSDEKLFTRLPRGHDTYAMQGRAPALRVDGAHAALPVSPTHLAHEIPILLKYLADVLNAIFLQALLYFGDGVGLRENKHGREFRQEWKPPPFLGRRTRRFPGG